MYLAQESRYHQVGILLEIPDGTVPRTSLINRILMESSLVAECCIFERRNGWKNTAPQRMFWKGPSVYVGQRRCWNDNEWLEENLVSSG